MQLKAMCVDPRVVAAMHTYKELSSASRSSGILQKSFCISVDMGMNEPWWVLGTRKAHYKVQKPRTPMFGC